MVLRANRTRAAVQQRGVTGGLQLGKATLGASGSFGLCFNRGLITRHACLRFFLFLNLILAIQSSFVTVLYFLFCHVVTAETK